MTHIGETMNQNQLLLQLLMANYGGQLPQTSPMATMIPQQGQVMSPIATLMQNKEAQQTKRKKVREEERRDPDWEEFQEWKRRKREDKNEQRRDEYRRDEYRGDGYRRNDYGDRGRRRYSSRRDPDKNKDRILPGGGRVLRLV